MKRGVAGLGGGAYTDFCEYRVAFMGARPGGRIGIPRDEEVPKCLPWRGDGTPAGTLEKERPQ